MTTIERLRADELRQVVASFRDGLRAHQAVINRLNVYPVPDGDTGTNMALTLEAVVTEVGGADADLEATCKAVTHGSLMGARGNSGVILSAILRGFSKAVANAGGLDGPALAAALGAATEAAYGAVGNPVEGTILTVVREAAAGAAGRVAEPDGSLVAVGDAALASGRAALARTPELLPVLAEAGVVDSGGTGFLLLLDALLHVADGRPMPEAPEEAEIDVQVAIEHVHAHGEGGGLADLRYEVMYFLEADDEAIPAFKHVWAGIGDSIVVVGGDGIWNCHIHTDDIGASIEAAIEIGRPSKIRVTDLLEEVEEERWVRESGPEIVPDERPNADPAVTAVVAVATGDGVRRIFHSLGVQQIVTGGQSMNPSTAQLIEAVDAAPADTVVILPNNKNIIPVAQQVAAHTSKTVLVVPTRGVAEGFAALMAYDPEASGDTNEAEMVEAAENVKAGEVTRAVRDSTCDVGPIAEGDYLGIAREGICAVEKELWSATARLLTELIGPDHEIVTLIEGEGATAGETRRITEWLAEHHPDVSAEVHHGGQPLYPYYVGIE